MTANLQFAPHCSLLERLLHETTVHEARRKFLPKLLQSGFYFDNALLVGIGMNSFFAQQCCGVCGERVDELLYGWLFRPYEL